MQRISLNNTLAHLCYGSYKDPLSDLKGKFTQAEIIDFVGRSKEEQNTKQLLNVILTDIGTTQVSSITEVVEQEEEEEEIDFSIDDDMDDIYGDYEAETSTSSSSKKTTTTDTVDVTDVSGVINKLIEVFEAK